MPYKFEMLILQILNAKFNMKFFNLSECYLILFSSKNIIINKNQKNL